MQEVLVVKAIELLMPFDGLFALQVIFLSSLVFAFSNYMFLVLIIRSLILSVVEICLNYT